MAVGHPYAAPRTKLSRLSSFGLAPNTPTPSSPAMSRIAFSDRTLLPASLSRGENAAIAKRPGTTATMPPPTPVLAGRPAVYIQSPDSS